MAPDRRTEVAAAPGDAAGAWGTVHPSLPTRRAKHEKRQMTSAVLRRRIRILLWLFIFGLVISGATAIPLETEVRLLVRIIEASSRGASHQHSWLGRWLTTVRAGVVETNARYPFIAYGTDWLAFGHFVIALAFIGPLREPVRNIWVVEWGMIACVLIVPFALGMGAVREIPVAWRLVDCSFGVLGIVPLWLCRRHIHELAKFQATSQ